MSACSRRKLHKKNQRREERVERHAGQQQDVGRQALAPGAREPIDDGDRAKRSRKAGDRHRRKARDPGRQVQRQRQHGAQCGARGHAKRERRGERVSQQRLKDDARGGERRSDHGAREHAGQPCDKEDLASMLSL